MTLIERAEALTDSPLTPGRLASLAHELRIGVGWYSVIGQDQELRSRYDTAWRTANIELAFIELRNTVRPLLRRLSWLKTAKTRNLQTLIEVTASLTRALAGGHKEVQARIVAVFEEID
jgi:hypothetical protein